MRAVINIHGSRDLHNEVIAVQRRTARRRTVLYFAALIALVLNFMRGAAQHCAALLSD